MNQTFNIFDQIIIVLAALILIIITVLLSALLYERITRMVKHIRRSNREMLRSGNYVSFNGHSK